MSDPTAPPPATNSTPHADASRPPETPAKRDAETAALRPWVLKAVLLGLGAQTVIIGWIVYSEIPAKVYISSWSFSMPGIFLLAIALVVSGMWKRLGQSILARKSLLLAYMMMAVSGIISGYGALQIAVPMMAGVIYRATSANNWGRWHDQLPAYLVPRDPDALTGLFVGEQRVPWGAWFLPICGWLVFLMAAYGAMIFLSSILSKQWIEGERLTYPVSQLPLEMTNTANPMYRNRLFWIGFLVPAVLETMLALNYYYPAIPAMVLKHRNMQPEWFPERPLSVMRPFYFGFSPFIVGLAYFAPLDVSFSVFFFNLLTQAERVYGAMAGYDTVGGGVAANRFPYGEEQAFGAFIAFSLAALWRTWPGLRRAWRERHSGDEEGRLMLFSLAGLAVCSLIVVWFLHQAGLPLWMAAAVLVLILLLAITLSRIRAEAGPAWVFGPYRDVSRAVIVSMGTANMSEQSIVGLSLFRWMSRDVRFLPMPFHMEAFKIAHSAGIRKRLALGVIFLATAAGILLGFYFVLTYGYTLGLGTSKASPGRINSALAIWRNANTWALSSNLADDVGTPWLFLGAGVCMFLMKMRTMFTWWPFHPIGYVMSETGAGRSFWFHYFLAWLFKTIVLRYGGHSLYVRSLPLIVGVILGDVLTQTAWSALAVILDIPVYQFIS